MQYLTFFWQFLSENSGQLQTLIGVFALILAVIAALFARKQILIANNQRLAELKLSILDAGLACQELIHEAKHKHKIYEEHFLKLLQVNGLTLDDIVDGFDYSHREYLDFPMQLLRSPEELTNRIIEEISENKQIKQSELEMYLESLIHSKGKIYSACKGYDRNVTNIDKGVDEILRLRNHVANFMNNSKKP